MGPAWQVYINRMEAAQKKAQGILNRANNTSYNFQRGGVFYRPSGTSGLAGSQGSGPKGLQSGFSSMLLAMLQDARKAGYSIGFSGWRSYEEQVRLKKQKPNLAATPGRSNHGWGLASDLSYGSAAAQRWVHANAARYGLRFPMSYEPWHIEPLRMVRR
jgi:LAS superfamily LD-carboxypeptidase LdcB